MRFLKRFSVITLIVQTVMFACMSSQLFADTGGYSSAGTSSGGYSGPSSPLPALPSNQQSSLHADYNPLGGPDYPLDQDSYFTDDNGNILMIINVLGQVNRQGSIVVREKVDFPSILALVGGVKDNANLTQVLVARQEPDKKGKDAYIIDLKKYYKTGDRSSFIALKPNDTIIVPEKGITLSGIASVFSFVFTGASGVYYLRQL